MYRDEVASRPPENYIAMNEKTKAEGPPTLLNRLHERRRQLERELRKVTNSIEFCEKNTALVEVVEIVLASREKCEPRPF